MRTILITGGYGFIGSNLIRYWLNHYPEDQVINLDGMTYAARPEWVHEYLSGKVLNYKSVICDITNAVQTHERIQKINPDHVIHLAAESHVCRSIEGPRQFFQTNVMGTFNLIEACRQLWSNDGKQHRFHHVSTDEVFGELEIIDQPFNEETSLDPRSPYAASKASSDHVVQSYNLTYGIDTVITNCSNNFGPNQHEEKLIPKAILSVLKGEEMVIHGDGSHRRDWIHVNDHCNAIDTVFHNAPAGSRYCIGGDREMANIDIVESVGKHVRDYTGEDLKLNVRFTNDRPTDDKRYAVSTKKIRSLGWSPTFNFHSNLWNTVGWYVKRQAGGPGAPDGDKRLMEGK